MSDVDIAIIGCGVMAEPYLRAAERRGLRVGVVETPGRLAALQERFPALVEATSVDAALAGTDEAWVAPAMELAGRCRPRGVFAFSEEHVLAAAFVQGSFDRPGPGMRASVVSRNKSLQRALLRDPRVGHPYSRIADPLAHLEVSDHPEFPLIIKPLSKSGSDGVQQISNQREWAEVLEHRAAETVLLEEFVDAQEYSWEGLVQGGRIIGSNLTRKTTTGAPDFVEVLHEVGFEHRNQELGASADELAAGALSGLDMRDGIVCVEFRDAGARGLVLMEAMVRMPGDFVVDAISLAQGFDWFEAVIAISLGEPLEIPVQRGPGYAAVFYLVAPTAGELRSLDLDPLRAIEGVAEARSRFELGSVVRPPQSSADRLGSVLFSATSASRLERAAEQVRSAADGLVDVG